MPLNEIGRVFERQYGVRVLYDYAGSGRLGNKILSGQIPDVFIPGSEKWANILHEKDRGSCTKRNFPGGCKSS